MAEDQPRTDRQLLYVTLLVAAAVLLWELLPFARAWITPYTFAILCAPLWLNLALADTPPTARRAYLSSRPTRLHPRPRRRYPPHPPGRALAGYRLLGTPPHRTVGMTSTTVS